MQVSDTRS